jgi:hypothetical protein
MGIEQASAIKPRQKQHFHALFRLRIHPEQAVVQHLFDSPPPVGAAVTLHSTLVDLGS